MLYVHFNIGPIQPSLIQSSVFTYLRWSKETSLPFCLIGLINIFPKCLEKGGTWNFKKIKLLYRFPKQKMPAFLTIDGENIFWYKITKLFFENTCTAITEGVWKCYNLSVSTDFCSVTFPSVLFLMAQQSFVLYSVTEKWPQISSCSEVNRFLKGYGLFFAAFHDMKSHDSRNDKWKKFCLIAQQLKGLCMLSNFRL